MTLKGHGDRIQSISYFPDGQRMISGSLDKTTRKWGLKTGKEIQEARDICEKDVCEEAVSRDGRWVVTGDGDNISDEDGGEDVGELKACEVETGNVKEFEGHSRDIYTVDISADSTLLASGSIDKIWNLETGKLVAGPFKSTDWVGAIRFSSDSKKLAVKSAWMTCLEFDALTLGTVGAPFEAHTNTIKGLALSFDCTLLISASHDSTPKIYHLRLCTGYVVFSHPVQT
ncbi:WD40 repeat-like protein [Suillus decipiens]|nr:WD40 repeat-like protein [Suillus decipiens]